MTTPYDKPSMARGHGRGHLHLPVQAGTLTGNATITLEQYKRAAGVAPWLNRADGVEARCWECGSASSLTVVGDRFHCREACPPALDWPCDDDEMEELPAEELRRFMEMFE